MFATAFKSSTRLAVVLSFTGLTGCASDGGLGEAAVVGAMLLPMPGGVDTSVMTSAVGLAAGAYVVSSVATADSASVSPATSTVAVPQGLPPIDLQKLVTRETPDRYRSKSCEYIEMSLSEVPMYQASAEPIMKQVATARKEAASQVWLEKGCQLANLPRGKIGASIDTIDPKRAMALAQPPAGVVVLATVPGSGAQQAGIVPQDVIVAVDDRPIADSIDFRVAVAKASIGSRVSLKVWRNNAFSVVPVLVGPGGTQVSMTPTVMANGVAAAIPANAMYCTAVLTTQHTYGAAVSPVKLIAGVTSDMQPSLKSYIAKVKQEQPGVWGDFKLNSAVCAPGAVVCMAEAKGPTGKTQNAFEFCHATQAKADAELAQMRQGDPKAVLVDWP
ncbi:PDZ domain-containing protein [Pseudomonas sp. 43mfcvi1.1]|uniref:PDZ domain-containing protein n=1 Tax=Pseudomonas sp. 43mfcvi1.1 TaxID=1761894 RepID=UPI000D6BFD04|nr:PDZ domain-containing protein [Pseudomonas sp. 43mfcvi1.1]PWJ34235.1 PDZ domain-containing protein [Pseudomonas sp. 43mfcvi1.1]SSB97381.1 PDZ domain-containing protein [Pseudomonas sp. 43mfcvi1.1]